MPEEFEEKTEQATPRRRQKAREKGEVPRSRELTGIMPLWVVFLYLSFGGFMLTALLVYLRTSLKRGFEVSLNDVSFVDIFRADTFHVGLMMAPFWGVMLMAIVVVHFLQTGFLISPAPLSPDINKINPIEGIKKFFSLNTIFETIKGIFKIIVLGLILYLLIKKELINLPLLVDMDIQSIAGFSFNQIKKLLLISATVLSVFAVADFAYQRWQYGRNLRMTKQEVKEEHKEVEGDPRVKARIKSLQREMARKRMMQEVPKADVVITNPTHFAVALKYESLKMGAPTVIAKGANLIAEKIKEIANKSGVPVFEDKPLARILFKLNIGQEIPETLYRAVATILANVYKLKNKKAIGNGR
ncbi:MAG: flagellar biosynthesis protein FlhB [Nitrospirae bacterium]|jgi:flagellar biosynthetic protein FlhB|nr:flagellar biosynthesis protein FlhB [Nitrospirota bacterium]MDA8214100.1 flagellar biosynthesis protein FlhB [Nitrospiraceae bacterium]MDA8339135.1 flagellar biosynthesis protein FlhB [Nitrospiraceae bacterium]